MTRNDALKIALAVAAMLGPEKFERVAVRGDRDRLRVVLDRVAGATAAECDGAFIFGSGEVCRILQEARGAMQAALAAPSEGSV